MLPSRVPLSELEVGAKFIACASVDSNDSIALIYTKTAMESFGEEGRQVTASFGCRGSAEIKLDALVIQVA